MAALFQGVSALLVSLPAQAQFAQQGPMLVGKEVTPFERGSSVALSSDSNTAAIGGDFPHLVGETGAAWLFNRQNGKWTQQGPKVIGGDSLSMFGSAVALSGDGSTLIVGGYDDASGMGGAWVFARSNGVWKQQGPKLVGIGADRTTLDGNTIGSGLGGAVALSADGNTAAVGGHSDQQFMGAVWIFIRQTGVWSQQGPKLVGFDTAPGVAFQGFSVALSADGNTLIVGGVNDDAGGIGAAWIFVRSGNVWSQQGPKLVGSEADMSSGQGWSVALSADGNTAIVGGFSLANGSRVPVAWVWTRQNGIWAQQGPKLVGTGIIGPSAPSVALSADGNIAIMGGGDDNNHAGAAWSFIRDNGVWTQLGSKLVVNSSHYFGTSVALSADGRTALVGAPYSLTEQSSDKGGAWIFALTNRPAVPPSKAVGVAAQRCYLDFSGGDPAAAIRECTNAIEINPNDENSLVNRCAAYVEQRNYSAAITDCTKAVALNSNEEYAYQERGLAYEALDQKASAIADLQKVLQLNPVNQLAQIQLEQLGASAGVGVPVPVRVSAPTAQQPKPPPAGVSLPAAPTPHGAPVPVRRSNP